MQTDELKLSKQPADRVLDIINSVVIMPSLCVAVNLDIAGLLKNGPKPASELAQMTGSHPDALYRLLRFLANEGIFTEMENHVFAQNEISQLLRKDVPVSLLTYTNFIMHEVLQKTLHHLPYNIQTGESAFRKAFDGMSFWEYFTANPETGQVFSESMASFSCAYDESIVSAYSFSDLQTVADVGGAYGSLLVVILKAYPHLRGILFDLPAIIEDAQKQISSEVADRCQLEEGSFLETVPSGVDAYLMRYILHDWNDEHCIQILKNCRQCSPNAKVLLVEHVIRPKNNSRFTLALDLWMFMLFDNAKERTEEEFRVLLEAAGYHLNKVIPTNSPFSIVECVPV